VLRQALTGVGIGGSFAIASRGIRRHEVAATSHARAIPARRRHARQADRQALVRNVTLGMGGAHVAAGGAHLAGGSPFGSWALRQVKGSEGSAAGVNAVDYARQEVRLMCGTVSRGEEGALHCIPFGAGYR
jgi:hypothetical protein